MTTPGADPGAERPEGAPLPEHEQRAWDAIVADLSGQIDLGPMFPADPPAVPPAQDDEDVEDDEDDGFEPPVPPPIPRPSDAVARFSWVAVVAGPLLVLLATIFDFDRWLADLGIVLAIGGFAALVWRMKDRDDDGDGAVI
jgi:hypothetical protein